MALNGIEEFVGEYLKIKEIAISLNIMKIYRKYRE